MSYSFHVLLDPLSRMPTCCSGNLRRLASLFLRGFVCEHVVPFCCVMSPGSCVRAQRLFVAGSVVLRLYKALDGLSSRW